jgi:hypothetical protein
VTAADAGAPAVTWRTAGPGEWGRLVLASGDEIVVRRVSTDRRGGLVADLELADRQGLVWQQRCWIENADSRQGFIDALGSLAIRCTHLDLLAILDRYRAGGAATPASAADGDAPAVIVPLAGVTPERVRWLWPGRLPAGKLVVVDGDPGLGKSTLLLDLAARLSRGAAMPDGARGDVAGPAGVVIMSAEDGLADTIVPRLLAAGADLERIVALQGVRDGDGERPAALPGDLAALREAIATTSAALVIVDPLVAHLAPATNAYRDQDVRRALAPLAALAGETGACVVAIRHLRKAAGDTNPLYRGGGSIGIIGAARVGLLVAADPDDPDRRVLAAAKSNLAALPPALGYRLVEAGGGVARVEWMGPVAHTAAALLAAPAGSDERGALVEAREWLAAELAGGGRPANEVLAAARAAGIAERTLRRARADLRVIARRAGFGRGGRWEWALPDAADIAPPPAPDARAPAIDGQTNHRWPSSTDWPSMAALAVYGDVPATAPSAGATSAAPAAPPRPAWPAGPPAAGRTCAHCGLPARPAYRGHDGRVRCSICARNALGGLAYPLSDDGDPPAALAAG